MLWFPRGILAAVMAAHGIAKVVFTPAFEAKFDLGPTVTLLAAVAELAAAVGFVAGGALRRREGAVVTLLAVAAVCCVQIPAIVMVHAGHGFLYFRGGPEYNLVLLALCAMLTVASVRRLRAAP
jgi:hypothetical protein